MLVYQRIHFTSLHYIQFSDRAIGWILAVSTAFPQPLTTMKKYCLNVANIIGILVCYCVDLHLGGKAKFGGCFNIFALFKNCIFFFHLFDLFLPVFSCQILTYSWCCHFVFKFFHQYSLLALEFTAFFPLILEVPCFCKLDNRTIDTAEKQGHQVGTEQTAPIHTNPRSIPCYCFFPTTFLSSTLPKFYHSLSGHFIVGN